jgi:hypothetical protein
MSKKLVSTEIKKLVIAHKDMTPADIVSTLAADGVKTTETSVAAYRSDFLNSIQVLREAGWAAPDGVVVPEKAKPKPKQQSRADRWAEAAADALRGLEELKSLQEEYEEWKESLPENLANSPVGEKLEEVCGIDLASAVDVVSECDGIDLPLGFGRD